MKLVFDPLPLILYFAAATIVNGQNITNDGDTFCFDVQLRSGDAPFPVGDQFVVDIFMDCIIPLHMLGTVVSSNKILTAAIPLTNVTVESITVSVPKGNTCPPTEPKGRRINVTNIYFHPSYQSNKFCHGIVVLEVDADLVAEGAIVTNINWDIFNIEGSVETFKCFENSEGHGGNQIEEVEVLQTEDHPCATITTAVGSKCSPMGGPVFSQSFLVGVEIACWPNCGDEAVYLNIIPYKEFIKPIIEGKDLTLRDLNSPSALLKTNEDLGKVFDKCDYKNNSEVIFDLQKNIENSSICDTVKEGMFQILEEYISIGFRESVKERKIPELLALGHCYCEYLLEYP